MRKKTAVRSRPWAGDGQAVEMVEPMKTEPVGRRIRVERLPESERVQDLSSHEGEEFIVVYAGRVEVTYGSEIEPCPSTPFASMR